MKNYLDDLQVYQLLKNTEPSNPNARKLAELAKCEHNAVIAVLSALNESIDAEIPEQGMAQFNQFMRDAFSQTEAAKETIDLYIRRIQAA